MHARPTALAMLTVLFALSSMGTGASWHIRSHEKVGGSTLPAPTGPQGDLPPLAIVDNRAVELPELAPALLEAAGGVVLGEWVLDRELQRRVLAAGLTITDADVRRERDLLADALGLAGLDPDAAQRAIEQERAARGLGPVRFDALLRRSAMLRALIASDAQPTGELIEQAYRTRFSDKLDIRLFVADDPARAALVRDELTRTPPPLGLELAFAERALRESVDATAAAGGLVEPFSAADTRYPEALRAAADALKPGELSGVVTLGARGAIVYLRARRPADNPPPIERVRDELRAQLLVGLQRRAMDALAAQIRRDAGVLVMDRALGWSWDRRPGAPGAGAESPEPPR